jgi:cytochrome c biogenesis protein CcmG/thiol:disulfide interchange protein DsbE
VTGAVVRLPCFLLLLVATCLVCASFGIYGYLLIRAERSPGGLLSDVQVGADAPAFELHTIDGDEVMLASFRGRPVVFNFWATWCAPCVAEIPLLNALQAEHADAGLVVVAVNVKEPAARVRSFANERGVDFTILLDPEGAVAGEYGVHTLPSTIWFDEEGAVRGTHNGRLSEEIIADIVRDVIREQPSPAATVP